MAKTAVLYARVSVFTGESVSIARQLDSCRKFAQARGWEVVGEFVDEGVSATKNKPEVREAWSALLTSELAYDAVVVWKVDRLTRRVVDFMRAHETLTKRGAGIVCVEQTIDMTTPEGRAFAQMLAVFAELEAAAISSRVVAARVHLLSVGRAPGGRAPYGWQIVPNPKGKGWIVAQDPERIDWVREMARRALRGDTVTMIVRWLDEAQAPFPFGVRRRSDHWWHASVERLLHNPMLAGMVPYKPARQVVRPAAAATAGEPPGVVLDADGRPVVRKDLAIISVAKREAMLARLDIPHQRVVAGHRAAAAAPRLFVGIARCGNCERDLPLRSGISKGMPVLRCPACHSQIFQTPLSAYVEQRLVRERGPLPMWGRDHAVVGSSAQLETIENELEDTVRALIEDRANGDALTEQITLLTTARAKARRDAGLSSRARIVELGMTVEEVWRRCATEEQRRRLLLGQVESMLILRGRQGGKLDPARIDLRWRNPDDRPLAPADAIGNPAGELVYDDSQRWITNREAAGMLKDARGSGKPMTRLRRALRDGDIEHRPNHGSRPSVFKPSLLAFVERQGQPVLKSNENRPPR